MTVSSEANIFDKTSGVSVEEGSGFCDGRLLCVVIDGRAYLVLSKSPREFSSVNTSISSNYSNEFVIRFSNRIFISIKSSKNVIEELRTACGGNLEIIESYKIISKSIHDELKKKIEKRYGHKDGFDYFTITSSQPNNPSGSNYGCVYRISQVPTPLLSVCFRRKYDDIDQQSKTSLPQMNPLLQQCVKRLLVGNIVLCHPFSEKAKSSVSLQLPSIVSMNERLNYTVLDATPNLRQGLPKERRSSFIYQILPSTRIILENHCEDFDAKDNSAQVPTDNLILNTIQAVRRCSNLNCIGSNGNNFNIDVPRAFFLSGPAGVGKTYQVRNAVEILNCQAKIESVRLISLRGSELLSLGPNEAEAATQLKHIFENAAKFSQKDRNNISLIFMDECDALLSSDILGATLCSLLDQLSSSTSIGILNQEDSGWKRLIVIAATNRIDAVPGYLRRPGRFDMEISVTPPTAEVRYETLKSILSEIDVSIAADKKEKQQDNNSSLTTEDLMNIADLTVGYVAADLSSLVRRALLLSISDNQNGQSNVMSIKHLLGAMQNVGASALRDASASAPPVTTWDDIAGDAGGAKTALRRAVEWPHTKKRHFERLGLVPPRGILLHGPPGCAKTTLARAAAGSASIAFLTLSPAEVYSSSYVGEAEGVIRRAFSLARSTSPCILFFDEIDSIVSVSGSNSSGMDRGTNAEARVLSTFLNEMDGIDGSISDGVLVLGATNRPSALDAALLRPGRFDRVIYVPQPDEEARVQILTAQSKYWKNNGSGVSMDVVRLAKDDISGLMTGAEIVGACREAAMLAMREMLDSGRNEIPVVTQNHLMHALTATKPLLSNSNILNEYISFQKEQQS